MNYHITISFDSLYEIMQALNHANQDVEELEREREITRKTNDDLHKRLNELRPRLPTIATFNILTHAIEQKEKVQLAKLIKNYSDCSLMEAYVLATRLLPKAPDAE